ncbi:hypothetical protein M409DRAFT_54729 [Zasmidium cellare ATCC 36951]|uniref:F-box domain-containing protein n=1 Tax=Zasmidium cellare ATCC 36951 TaxID=1080233 RepID=A0A6A6CMJ7_ZASCE|nr:uncharacterized protein M409DRAFT_54729 [Zasmidium cellare ATCC 36951]KAF2166969.1 hypothetical protein M409DRAFT_54729 [Zasmidium cellare ATCC 36951]
MECLLAQQLAIALPSVESRSIVDMEIGPPRRDKILGMEDYTIEPPPTTQVARPSEVWHESAPTSSKPTPRPEVSFQTVTTNLEAFIEPTVAQRVLGTVELLEMVLLELPIATLFTVQRVNTKFHDTITGSIHLRRVMFLETDPSFEASNKQQINPMLEQCTFTPKSGLYLELVTKTANPLYRSLTDCLEIDLPYFTTPTSKRSRLRDKVWLGHVRKPTKPLMLPHRTDVRESWQYMLLKQGRPAKTSVRLWHHFGKISRPLDYAREKFRKRTYMGRVWRFIKQMH